MVFSAAARYPRGFEGRLVVVQPSGEERWDRGEGPGPKPGVTSARAAGKPRKPKPPTPEELYKLSVADELGLGEKVRRVGWGGLSAAETGRVGGYITRKAREKATAREDDAGPENGTGPRPRERP
jgi:hypothetical protein